jgi:putative ABC transport system permease protein
MKLFHWRRRRDEDLDAEIRHHLDQAIRDRIERGETPDEARTNALREFGNVGLVKEVTREMWGWASLERLAQDLRFGLRMMRKNPGFSLIAILTLAVGMGANTTIFSAIESVILHPFSLPHQERLVVIYERILEAGVKRTGVTPGTLQDWREQSQMFEQFVTMKGEEFYLTGTEQPERIFGDRVSAGYFAALGVQPLLGRTFQDGEDTAGREQLVVLKHSLWQRRFGADPTIVGQTITLNGKSYTVIGVMPEGFNFPYNGGELWTPFVFPADRREDRANHHYFVLGLLKPGVTMEQGATELHAFSRRAQTLYPATNSGVEAIAADLNEDYTHETRVYLSFTLGAVLFVLLIACANVANLLLVRGSARRRELALRMALGGSRWRVMRQLLTESVLLAVLGGILGLCLAYWGVTALANGLPLTYARSIPGWEHLGLNVWALGFTAVASLLTGLLFGLMPAWQATRTDFNETLKEGGKGVTSGARNRLRNGLVVAEVALSLMLLVAAGLVVRSFIILLHTDLGFYPDNAISMRIVLPRERYTQPEQRLQFIQELERRVASLPGVSKVGVGDNVPGGWSGSSFFHIVGQPPVPRTSQPTVATHIASPGYFAAIGTPLLAGRMLTAHDEAKVPVILVNEAFEHRYFPGGTALGERLSFDGGPPAEIVGIVGNMMNSAMDDPAEPSTYAPITQFAINDMMLVVRGQTNQSGQEGVTQIVGAIREELAGLDANLPLSDVKPMDETIRDRISPKRIITVMLGLFASLALLMATVGLYAVMSFVVMQRTHEIGIRLVLGAQMKDVCVLILKQGLRLVMIGVVIGLAGAFGVSGVLSQVLYGITATDPMTYLLVAAVLITTAFFACWIPALRATKVDPMVALRHE